MVDLIGSEIITILYCLEHKLSVVIGDFHYPCCIRDFGNTVLIITLDHNSQLKRWNYKVSSSALEEKLICNLGRKTSWWWIFADPSGVWPFQGQWPNLSELEPPFSDCRPLTQGYDIKHFCRRRR